MKWPRLTLTARLTVLFTGVAVSVLLGLGILVAWATDRHFVELDHSYLSDKAHLVEKFVSEARTRAELKQVLDELLGSHNGLFIQVWRGGDLVYGPADLAANAPAAFIAEGNFADWRYSNTELRGLVVELKLPADSPWMNSESRGVSTLVAVDTAHHEHFLMAMKKTLALYILVASLISGLLGWWVARKGLAPLKGMRERAKSITVHNLRERMPVNSVPVELAELAAGLNGMFDRLNRDFQRLMDFSGDLAHELRTPLSNLLTQTQVALAQRRNPDEYREILASNAEEFERLSKMVSDMLFLAKMENGIDLPHREHIRLDDEVRALFDFYEAVAGEKNIRLVTKGRAAMDGDRLMIRRAISNLLSNALRHADTGSLVEIDISSDPDTVQLEVINQGQVISADDMPRLFDRFYRADRSRGHPASEGAGLGLAITKAIVESHGGRIGVRSSARRTSFYLMFPVHHGTSSIGQSSFRDDGE
jgi:two-component system heavy metal sensor histidine kinase CusS